MKITIVICTKDRPKELRTCLRALSRLHIAAEILVVDGSETGSAFPVVQTFRKDIYKAVDYLREKGGLSKARNKAILTARGDILTFLDDDCIPAAGWMSAIRHAFDSMHDVGIVFGPVEPYGSGKHTWVSMSLHAVPKRAVISKIPSTITGIGTGNNMSVKRSVFANVGGFAPWLGLGSSTYASEDEEFAYRSLQKGVTILEEPKALVYHNRWITRKERMFLLTCYSCGLFALFAFHAFTGDRRARTRLYRSAGELIWQWITSPGVLRGQRVLYCFKGIAIGAWQAVNFVIAGRRPQEFFR